MTPALHALDDATRSRLALDAFGTGIWDWHLPSGELYLSPSWKAQLGFADEELPNAYDTWESRVHPDDLAGVLARVKAYLDGKAASYDVEFRLQAKQGDYRWIRARGHVVERDATGKPARVIGIHDDVTDRKEAELALRRSEEKFFNLFELSPDAIGISRMVDGRLIEANRALEEITGYPREELIGSSTLNLWIDPEARADLVRRVAGEGDVVAEIHRFRAKDGHVVDGLVAIRRVMHEGEPHLLFVVRDVTGQQHTERALRDSEARWQFALEGAGAGVWDWQLSSDELYLAPGWKAQLGYRDDELANEYATWASRVHPEDMPRVQTALEEYLSGRRPDYDVEFRMRARSGDDLWIRARGKIVERDADGAPVRIIGVHDDITARKQTEIGLQRRIVALTRPLGVSEDIQFSDLVNLDDIQELQDLFADAFGVASLITTPDGVPITRPSNFSRLCGAFIRNNAEGMKLCEHSDAMLGQYNPGGPNIQHCLSAGLCNAGAGITVGGHHVANWLIGQVRDETHDDRRIIRFAKQIGADPDELVEAFHDIPEMPREQFERIARILYVMANQISTMAYQNVQQARFIAERMQAEQALRARTEETAWLMKSMASAFIVWGIGYDDRGRCDDLRFEYFNDAYAATSGLKLDAVRGKSIHEVWPDAEPEWFEIYGRVATGGRPEVFERYFAATGGWYACNAYRPWESNDRICVVFDDVTQRHHAEARIRVFEALAESSMDAIVIADAESTTLTYANRAAHEMFGCDFERLEMLGLPGADFWPEADLDALRVVMTQAVQGGWRGDVRQRRRNGDIFEADASVFTIPDAESSSPRVVAIIRDISDRKHVEEALRLTQASVDHASEAIFWYDAQGRFSYVNDEASRMLGYARDELTGMSILDVDATIPPERFEPMMADLLASGSIKMETVLRRKDGVLIDVDLSAMNIRHGEHHQLVAHIRDITEQKGAVRALRSEKTFSDTLIDSLPGIFYLFDEQGRLLRWNATLSAVMGYDTEALSNMSATDFVVAEDRDYIASRFAEILRTGTTTAEGRLLTARGEAIPYYFTGRRIVDGERVLVVGAGIDIGERRRAEEALRLIRFGVERSADAVFLIDPSSRFLDVNEATCASLGYAREELLGLSIPDIDPGVTPAMADAMFAVLRANGRLSTETVHRRRDGTTFPVEIKANYIEFDGKEYNFCYARDISERKAADEALRLSEARFRAVIDNISEVISIVDAQGTSLYQSPALRSLYGYDPETFSGRNALSLVHPDDMAMARERFAALLRSPGSVDRLEYRYRHADGGWVNVESNAIALLDDPAIGGVLITSRDITARKRADAALHLTRRAIEAAALAFEWYDETGRIVDVNAQCCRDLGYSREELLKLSLCDIDPDYPAELWPDIRARVKALGTLTAETSHRRKDGTLFPVVVTANYVEFEGREYIFTYAQDVTERNRVDRELKATQHAIDHASSAFEWIDAEGKVIGCNIQAHRALGYERDEFVGLRVWDYDPDMSQEKWALLWTALRRDGHATLETRHRRKDGFIFPIEVTVNHGVFGEEEYCFAYINDISERKAAEERLRLTQFAVDSSSIAFQWVASDGRILGCNRRAHESLGYTREEFIGSHVWDFDPDFPAEGMAAHWAKLKQAGKLTFESRHRHKDGHTFQVEVTTNLGEFGGQEYAFVYVVDITERKAAEEHLRIIQNAVDRSSVAFEWLDMEGRIISGNIQAYESLGYTRDEFVGLNVMDFTPGLDVDEWRRHVELLRQRGSEFVEGEHRRKDGSVFPIEVRANYVKFGEREYIFSYINDISERKAAEQALRDSERRLAELFDFLPDATFAVDTQGAVIAWNRAMETMSGVGKADVLGKTERAYAQAFYGHKRPMLVDLVFDYDEAVANRYDHIRKDGDSLVTEDQTAYLYGKRRIALWGKAAPLRDTEGRMTGAVEVIRDITEQKDAERALRFSEERFRSVVSNTPVLIFEFDDEGVFKLNEGRGLKALGLEPGQLVHTSVCEFFHDDPVVCGHIRGAIEGEAAQFTAHVGKTVFETYFNPVVDPRSQRMSVIGVAVDITERTEREAELQQKTDEMTRFTYTVSHDLKSPLVTIRTFLGFLEQDIQKQDGERIAKDMGFIRKAAEKMTHLLEELLELSRIGRVVNSPVDTPFDELAREAVDLVAGRIAERAVDVRIEAPAIRVHGDRQRLVEVFQNLVDNAVKFMGAQPRPRIEIGAEARDGTWVFHVRDNGIGLDARYLDKVFGLFEKLDANAEGTGIGLTLVKRIVEIHGGRIWVESPGAGQGTTFYFTLEAVRGAEKGD